MRTALVALLVFSLLFGGVAVRDTYAGPISKKAPITPDESQKHEQDEGPADDAGGGQRAGAGNTDQWILVVVAVVVLIGVIAVASAGAAAFE
jgi:hypothetical protein